MQDYSGYGQPPYGPTTPMPPMPPRPPRRRTGALSYVLVALVAGALGAGSVVALYHPAASSNSASAQPSVSAPAPQPSAAIPQPSSGSGSSGTSASEQAILAKVAPGLVIINTALQYNSEAAAATGIVITSGGLVLTNNHVIEDSTSITATTANGKQYKAKVVGYDVTGDIALIQLQGASGLRTAPLGTSSAVKTGDQVVAMGNAEGQNAIVPAAGTVTGLNQTITAGDQGGSVTSETLHGMIQTNADVVSGDSGGPLADSAGNVIGMDTAGNNGGFSIQQSNAAGYAIPIETALTVARQINTGQASSTVSIGYPPFLGVYIGQGSDSQPAGPGPAAAGHPRRVRRLRRQRQPGLLHQRPQPGRPAEHRGRLLRRARPRDHLRRPGRGRGHVRRFGHHRGERPPGRRPGQPDRRGIEVPPRPDHLGHLGQPVGSALDQQHEAHRRPAAVAAGAVPGEAGFCSKILTISSTGRPLVSGRNFQMNAMARAHSAAKQTSTPPRLMAFCQTGNTSTSRKLASTARRSIPGGFGLVQPC